MRDGTSKPVGGEGVGGRIGGLMTTHRGTVRLALVAGGLVAVVLAFRHVDWTAVRARLVTLGPRAPLVAVPYFFILSCDALGWRSLFRGGRCRPPFWKLWRLQTEVEAVLSSAPGGVAVGESLRVALLKTQFGLGTAEATAHTILAKLGMGLAQSIFVLCGQSILVVQARAGELWLPPGDGRVRLWAALTFFVVACGAPWLLVGGRALRGLRATTRRLRRSRPGAKSPVESALAQLDGAFALFRRAPRARLGAALAYFLAAWFCLAGEDWLILRLLGARVSCFTAVSMQAAASVVRMIFFFVPGALGAQDVSYQGLFRLYGVANADAVAAAFILVKRANQLVWIVLGYAALALVPSHASAAHVVRRRAREVDAGSGVDRSPADAASTKRTENSTI